MTRRKEVEKKGTVMSCDGNELPARPDVLSPVSRLISTYRTASWVWISFH